MRSLPISETAWQREYSCVFGKAVMGGAKPEAGVLLGLDIGGTQIKAACVDESGAIVRTGRVNTPASLDDFRQAVRGLLRELLTPPVEIGAAGIGCKGIINPQTTRVEVLPGTVRYLEGELLSEIVAPVLPAGIPIAADNDARGALAGGVGWGGARGLPGAARRTLGARGGGGTLATRR